MLLYNITFPKNDFCVDNRLYFRGGELCGGGLTVKKGETVTFDTFFNCFSHTKYSKYTIVNEVTLKLDLEGRADISLYLYDGAEHKLLAEKEFTENDEICLKLSDLDEKGIVYFAIKAKEDCVLRSGGWYGDADGNDARIGIVICTYKREEYVKRNIRSLVEFRNGLQEHFFDVFAVDNGQTLDEDFGDGITVIPNENTGGSGGFTRGMQEVRSLGAYTHFLLMDDDIVFDVNTIWRTYSLLRLLKDEYKNASVGGAMLLADSPHIQMEMGADWNGVKLFPHRKRVDVRNAREIVENEADSAYDYNGWFYTCMPVSTIDKYGYPLPLFIKCDDMEYGLRAAEHWISMSGISVWHEDFDVKYVPGIEYYNNRNELIFNSYFPKGKGAFANYIKLLVRVGRQLVMQRYYAVDLIFRAYEDFFKGPDFVFNLNGEKNHKDIRRNFPVFLSEEELSAEYSIKEANDYINLSAVANKGIKLKHVVTLNGYLIPKCFYKKEMSKVNMAVFNVDGFFMRKQVLQFNPITGKGFVTEIKKAPFVKACFKLFGYFFKMTFCYRRTAKKYRSYFDETEYNKVGVKL